MIRESSAGDEYIAEVLNAFPKESISDGVYPEEDLKSRFAYVSFFFLFY